MRNQETCDQQCTNWKRKCKETSLQLWHSSYCH